ncbi:MAG: hypothetical protein ABJD11_01330 [Gemmatimonadota bacterium]
MYRIRLGSGEQTVFKSVEELALGLQSGTVDPAAQVFDRDSSRWMPIEQHPDYAAARSHDDLPTQLIDLSNVLQGDERLAEFPRVGAEGSAPLADAAAALDAGDAGVKAGSLPGSVVPLDESVQPPAPEPSAPEEFAERTPIQPVSHSPLPPSNNNSRWLTLGGGILVAVIAVGFLSARASRSDDAQAIPSSLLAVPDSFGTLSGTDSAAGVGVSDSTPQDADPAQAYAGAYASARAAFDGALGDSGFKSMFAAERLASVASIKAARTSLSGASRLVLAYHEREGAIESTYRAAVPTDVGPSLRESFDTKQLTVALLASADSVYQLLLQEQGQYEISGSQLLFANVRAAQRYGVLASFLGGQLLAIRDSSDFAQSFTSMRISRGLGSLPSAFRR